MINEVSFELDGLDPKLFFKEVTSAFQINLLQYITKCLKLDFHILNFPLTRVKLSFSKVTVNVMPLYGGKENLLCVEENCFGKCYNQGHRVWFSGSSTVP